MSADLHIDVTDQPGQLPVAAVAGPLDLHTAPRLYRHATHVLQRYPSLILGLAGVTFCDSSGLNSLIRLRRRAQEAGGRLILAGPPPQLARMLALTGADTILPVHGSVAEAQAAHSVT
ncbi:STAS domain-containing protein [Streptomyces sp. NPDC006314]|uniref:STAS domain-containing protein n=1 Tax=Streptomyces sp. NPDC006314 TaxID=3154475 RepID=UPI0033BE39F7